MYGLRESGAERAASIGEETLGTVGGAGGVDDARRILAMYAGFDASSHAAQETRIGTPFERVTASPPTWSSSPSSFGASTQYPFEFT